MNTYAGLLSVSTSSGIQLNSIAFSPNGQTLAGGGGIFASGSSGGGFVGGVLNLWNALTGAPVSSLKTAANNVYSVAYSSDGSVLACGGQSTDSAIGTTHGLVELWNLANGTLTATLNTSAVYVYSVAISPDGKSLAVGGGNPGHREGVLEVWSVQSHQLVSSLGTANTVSVNSVAFSPDGSMVAAGGSGYDTATGSVSHAIELWNVASLTLEKTLQTTADVVDSVAFSPDGSLLADGGNAANNSNFGMFELWDLSLGATDATASGIGAPSIVAFSPQANVLFGEGINATNVLNLKTNSFFDTFVPIGTSLALSPDGTLMAIGAAGAGFLYVLPNPYFIDSVSKLSIGASTVIGGNTTTGTITMTGPAGENGAVVTLSSNSSTATVPATITINPGQRTGTFTISTGGVVKQATAVITASANGKTQTGSVTILPAGIASVTVGSSSATGTVTLNGSAGTGGFHVALSSSSALAGVPSSVTVAAGQSSATFHVVEAAVGKTTTVTITAKAGTVAKTTTLTLTPPTLVSLTLDSTSVAGGSASTGTVTLSGVAPAGGISVKLFSSSVSAKIPVTVTVAGGKDSATFKVTTSAVSSQAAATLTAELGATSATASLEILPPSLKSIALSPTQVKGGKSSTATVTISSPAPTGGVVIALTSSLGSVSVPTSIKIPAGKTTGTFTVKTSAVTTQTQANIGASMSGVSKTAVLTIL